MMATLGHFHQPFVSQLIAPRLKRVLKFASLLNLVRLLPVVWLASVLVMIASVAQAWQSCERVEQYEPVSDPLIRQKIEAHVQATPAFKNRQIRKIHGHFAIVWQDEEECRKVFRCHYLLLDLRDNAVKDVFAFRGTGTVWTLGSPVAVWSEPLRDDYSYRGFETEDFVFLLVQLPRWSGPVWVDAPTDTKMLADLCGAYKYK
jgi:hypothetical protein